MANKRRRYGEQRNSIPWLSYALIALFSLLAAWLLIALIRGENPIGLLKKGIEKTNQIGTNPIDENDPAQLKVDSLHKVIDSLRRKIEILEGTEDMATAIVRVQTSQLNVRALPSIAAELAFKIPPNNEVKIMEYDSKTYILDGKSGQWCKILYRGNEGWVWGNYLEIVE